MACRVLLVLIVVRDIPQRVIGHLGYIVGVAKRLVWGVVTAPLISNLHSQPLMMVSLRHLGSMELEVNLVLKWQVATLADLDTH